MSYIIAEYKFDNILYDLIPEFNEGFEYTYEDILEGNVTTRTIYSNELPTLLRFGNSDTSGETGDSNKYNSLLEVLYLASSEITYAGLMFHRCANVSYICPFILTNKNNSLHGIFSGCHALTSLDVSNFDTSNVTDMSYAFYTNNLIELDLSDWDTSNVTNMNHILYSCQNLKTLNISNWNLNNVDNIGWFVNQCNNLNEIIMNDSDYNSINKIITELPITTNGSKCIFCIGGVDDISKVNIREGWDIMNQYKIAKYTTNASGVLPTFNEGYQYTVNETNSNGIYTVELYSDTDFTSCSFSGKTNLLTVEYLKVTNKVTSMCCLFDYCSQLTQLDVSNWDTSNVTDMNCMFHTCSKLTQLDVSNWDTSNVTDMSYMFYRCSQLTQLDLSNFDTSKVIYMSYMFDNCSQLTQLNLSNFDTSKVTDMSDMFSDCSQLTQLDLNNFNTSKVIYMSYMFDNCSQLTQLNLSNFDTSKVTDMSDMFSDCSQLTQLDLNNFNTSKVIYMSYMFDNCSQLTQLDLSNFDTSNITDMSDMFYGCYNLNNIIMNNSNYSSVNKVITQLPTRTSDSMGTLNIAGVDDISQVDINTAESKFWNIVGQYKIAEYKFNNTSELVPVFNEGFTYTYEDVVDGGVTTRTIYSDSIPTMINFTGKTNLLEVYYLETSNLTSAVDLFYNCTGLTYVDLRNSDFSKVESIERMFNTCTNLVAIDGLNDLDISNVNNMGGVFSDCRKLPEINVSNWNVSKVTNFGAAFRRCYELTSIDSSNWDTSSATIMSGVFTNCSKLTEIDLSNWKMDNVTTINQMFYGCSKLTSVKLFNHINNDVNTGYLFTNCKVLNKIEIYNSDFNTINSIISVLPEKTSAAPGTLNIKGVDKLSRVNLTSALSKYWIVIRDQGAVTNIHVGDNLINNKLLQNKKIKNIYIGDSKLL